jgi:hypothetical protein
MAAPALVWQWLRLIGTVRWHGQALTITRPIVRSVQVSAYRIPTDVPESDGTIAWKETTIVVVRLAVGSCEGLGYSYADAVAAHLVRTKLGEAAIGMNRLDYSERRPLLLCSTSSSSIAHRIALATATS